MNLSRMWGATWKLLNWKATDNSPQWGSRMRTQFRIRSSPGETLPCTLMAPGKIRRGCNVLQIPIQIIPLGVQKWRSHPLRGESKLRWQVSGLSFEINTRPSEIAHKRCSRSKLNPSNPTEHFTVHEWYSLIFFSHWGNKKRKKFF